MNKFDRNDAWSGEFPNTVNGMESLHNKQVAAYYTIYIKYLRHFGSLIKSHKKRFLQKQKKTKKKKRLKCSRQVWIW